MGTQPPRLTRRTVLGAAAGLAVVPGGAFGAGDAASDHPNKLWYRQPAATWNEALPVGNGRLGAMVFGRVGQERLQLNEATLWAGSPYTPDNPDALAALPEVRRLLADGRYKEATELAAERMMAKPLKQMPYGTLGDLLLTFQDAAAPTDYVRELDLSTGIASTRFSGRSGRIHRELFASAPDQVIVMRLEAESSRIGFDLGYRGPRKVASASPNYQGAATTMVAPGATDWLMREETGRNGADISIRPDGTDGLLITGRNQSDQGIPAGLTYALCVRILSDGAVETSEAGMSVRNARAVTLLISAATSYVDYHDVSGDAVAAARARNRATARKTYATLKRDHIADHRALFDRTALDLGRTPAAGHPTDVRIANAETADDPALAALYLQFGRYLLIASSRPGGQPATLQGLWNEGTDPPWGSKYTININTEMNYWPADPANLGDCVEPLLRMVEDLSVTGAKTARTMYGARGWVAHHNTDLWRAAAPIDGPLWGLWPCGGAWLCNTLWTHWDYHRDARLLARLYPLMKGASLFFLDTLIEDPKGRGLITSPSLSPENIHPFGSSLCAGPAMDRQIIRDLFAATVVAGRQLGQDAPLLQEIEKTRARIAPDRIGKSGQLQEWLEDWDDEAPEQHHRHVSHLYAIYPSGQINVRDTPALIDAAKVSLTRRGDLSTGWATAWRACLWARMGEGEHAHRILKGLLGPQRTYPNMFDAHPPFQIDGNFGGSAAILEMLVQSWGGELHLLPALPREWPSGTVRGVCARGGLTVDLSWSRGSPSTLTLRGPAQATVRVRGAGGAFDARLDPKGIYRKRWA